MRGMFRFGCSSAYGPHSYSVLNKNAGPSGTDNVEFRSYLYELISQASKPRQKDENKVKATIHEIFPGIRMGPDAADVSIICIAFCVLIGVGIGGCYLLGWAVDNQARQARLQCAEEYAARHPAIVQELEPQIVAQQYPIQTPQYSSDFGLPATQPTQQYSQPSLQPAQEYVQPAHEYAQLQILQQSQQGAVRTHFPQHQRRQFYTSANGVPGNTGIAGGAPVYHTYTAASSGSLNGSLRNDQVYMYWR
jgi:hypothetical protein